MRQTLVEQEVAAAYCAVAAQASALFGGDVSDCQGGLHHAWRHA